MCLMEENMDLKSRKEKIKSLLPIKYFYEDQSGRKEINYFTKRRGSTNSFGKVKHRLNLKQLKRDLKKVS